MFSFYVRLTDTNAGLTSGVRSSVEKSVMTLGVGTSTRKLYGSQELDGTIIR